MILSIICRVCDDCEVMGWGDKCHICNKPYKT